MSIAPDGSYLMPDEHGVLRSIPANPLRPLPIDGLDAASIFGPPAAPKPRQILGNSRVIDRLYWRLNGRLEQSIFVIPEGRELDNIDNAQPLFTASGLHPLGHQRINEDRHTSILVESTQLSYSHPNDWYETHRQHDSAQQQFADMIEDDQSSDGGSLAGEAYDEDDQPLKLMRCCGTVRPSSDISSPTVDADPPAQDITIKDYVTKVHPWLMSKREDFIAAISMYESRLPANVGLVVDCRRPADISVMIESDWLLGRRARRAAQSSTGAAANDH